MSQLPGPNGVVRPKAARVVGRLERYHRKVPEPIPAGLPERLEALPLPAFACAPGGTVLAVNRAFAALGGNATGTALVDLVHPGDRAAVAALWAALEGGAEVAGQDLRLRADGSARWVRASVRQTGEAGSLLLATLQDIHDLKEREAELHLTQEASGLGGWSLDPASGTLHLEARTLDLLGLSGPSLPLPAFLERIHPEDRARVEAALAAPASSGAARLDYRFTRGDGRKIWVEHHLRPEVDGNGRPGRLLGVLTDFTARKEAELRLTLLARAGETLTQDLDVRETLGRLARLTVPGLADWCAVYLPQPGGALHPVASAHRDPAREALAAGYLAAFPQRVDDSGAVSRVYRENVPALLSGEPEELLGTWPLTEKQAQVWENFGSGPSLLVPLAVRGQVLGTLSLALHRAGRSFGQGDVPFVQELARRAALALDNAGLYAQARGRNAELERRVAARTAELEARNRALEAFAELSRDLSAEQDPGVLVGRAQELLVGLLPGGVSTYHERREERWTLTSRRGLPLQAASPETLHLDRPFETREAFYPASGPGAAACLPVLVGGEPRGVLVVATRGARAWAAEERVLLETTARALGLALERAGALDELQRERVFLSGLLRSLSEGIVACDAQGRLTLFNGTTEALHGLPLEPLPPERWAEHYGLYRADGRAHLEMEEVPLYRAWRGEHVENAEMLIRPRDGSPRIVVSVGGPIVGGSGATLGAVVAMRDVTGRVQGEAALREANENLRRSNQELERFAYVASHDLQTPLRAITSFAGLLQARYGERLDERGHTYLRQIVRGGERMKRLVDDLLSFSRVNTHQRPPQPLSSAAVLDDALTLLRPELEEVGGLVTSGPLPTVLADEGQFSRVLVHLLGNALKYRRAGVPPRIHVSAQREGELWRFAVSDNGEGIEERYFDQVFVPFQRLHTQDHVEGSGLGLAVGRKVIERHGGRLWLESVPGEGSTFYFTLPDAEGARQEG